MEVLTTDSELVDILADGWLRAQDLQELTRGFFPVWQLMSLFELEIVDSLIKLMIRSLRTN